MNNILSNSTFTGGKPEGFLPLTGGALSDNLLIHKASLPAFILDQTTLGTRIYIQNNGNSISINHQNAANSASNLRSFQVHNSASKANVKEALRFLDVVNGTTTSYRVYGEHNIDLLQSQLDVSVEIISYVGTGTYGSSNPNILDFQYKPKAIVALGCVKSDSTVDTWGTYTYAALSVFPDHLTTSYNKGDGFQLNQTRETYAKLNSDGSRLYWYNEKSAQYQLNLSGDTYYIAVFYQGGSNK